MVTVVQLVEHQVVILAVAGSSPVGHPEEKAPILWIGAFFVVGAHIRFMTQVTFEPLHSGRLPKCVGRHILVRPERPLMKRSTVVVALAAATVLGPVAGTSAAQTPGLPLTDFTATPSGGMELPGPPETGSAQSGSTGGLETTGSSGTGSAGLPNLDRLLFGGRILCGALGSAMAVAGEAMMDCADLPTPV